MLFQLAPTPLRPRSAWPQPPDTKFSSILVPECPDGSWQEHIHSVERNIPCHDLFRTCWGSADQPPPWGAGPLSPLVFSSLAPDFDVYQDLDLDFDVAMRLLSIVRPRPAVPPSYRTSESVEDRSSAGRRRAAAAAAAAAAPKRAVF